MMLSRKEKTRSTSLESNHDYLGRAYRDLVTVLTEISCDSKGKGKVHPITDHEVPERE